MPLLNSILFALLSGVVIYIVTALIIGKKKANRLPGGALCAGLILHPWYVCIPVALIGHFLAVAVAKKLK